MESDDADGTACHRSPSVDSLRSSRRSAFEAICKGLLRFVVIQTLTLPYSFRFFFPFRLLCLVLACLLKRNVLNGSAARDKAFRME